MFALDVSFFFSSLTFNDNELFHYCLRAVYKLCLLPIHPDAAYSLFSKLFDASHSEHCNQRKMPYHNQRDQMLDYMHTSRSEVYDGSSVGHPRNGI
jgi:hypothetical protein